MKREQSPLQKAYLRERNRINRAFREIKKYGFETEINVPKIPKNITQASVRRLQNLTTKKIYESATGARPVTGEQVDFKSFRIAWRRSNSQQRKEYEDALKALNFKGEIADLIKKQRAEFDKNISTDKPASPITHNQQFNDTVPDVVQGWEVAYDNFISIVENYADRAYEIVKQRIDFMEYNYGKEAVGNMFIEATDNGVIVDASESYNIGLIYRMLTSMARMLQLNENDTRDFVDSLTDDNAESDLYL